jgi:hypothetical protein
MKRIGWTRLAALLPGLLLLPLLLPAQEGKFIQFAFEGRETSWIPGAADAPYKETAHRLTEETAHGGQRSELIELEAQQGSFIHYAFPVGRGPVTEDFSGSVWVRANRPGVQLLARLVLPHERDPKKLDQPLTTLLRGDVYESTGRWFRLQLRKPQRLIVSQQQLLRIELGRDVDVSDAYVDQIILNVYGGPGLTRVWTDDLEVGPVLEEKKAVFPSRTTGRQDGPSVTPRVAEIKLQQQQLNVSGKKFFLRGIRYSGTPLKTLRDAGFNTIWVDEQTDAATIEQAVNLGFWLVPMLGADDKTIVRGSAPGVLTSSSSATATAVGQRMARFLQQDAVLCWDLGGGLAAEQYTNVTRTANALRAVDPLRPLAGDVWDGFRSYSRGIDQFMLGVHRWPLMTGLELTQYRDWLSQRRQLAQPGTYSWTYIQTHLPDWFTHLVYEKPSSSGFNEPIGPQPEQLRLMTYAALGSGSRGLCYWSDRFLADSHAGRDRLLELALLNLEMQLLEPMLVTAQTPAWIGTSQPTVKAAVMRTDYGVLCLPVWTGTGSQMVPGQAAVTNLSVVVPQVPNGTQAWLVSPGEVRTLKVERVVGGCKVTIPEFGLTAAVVFTGDLSQTGLVVNFQDQVRRMSKIAAQWTHDLAEEELAKVTKVHADLEQEGQKLPDGWSLIEDARKRVALAASYRRDGDAPRAYAEAERAMRPLRILMRAHFDAAVKELDAPVSSPYAVSFYTLPRHWRFRDEIAHDRVSANVLPEGDFEQPAGQTSTQWGLQESPSLDDVTVSARRVTEEPLQGKQALLLEVTPKDPKVTPQTLERTFLAVHSPSVRLKPGSLVRISAWVRIPKALTATTDGALFYDSAGGEPLAVRLTEPTKKWKQYTLYRRVPASGNIQVTLALMGLGKVYFDDVKIEPLVSADASPIKTVGYESR